MKFISIIAPLLIAVIIFSCSGTKEISQTIVPNGIPLICKVDNCKDSLGLYQFDGLAFKKLQTAKKTGKDSFIFYLPGTGYRFYYVGEDQGQKKSVLAGADKTLFFQGNCSNMRKSAVIGSEANEQYTKLTNDFTRNKSEMGQIIRQFRGAQNDPAKMKEVMERMAVIDQRRLSLLDSLKRTEPFLAKIAALETFLSFPNNQGSYTNDLDHYVNEFFHFVNLKDPDYNNIPYVFEAFKQYATTLSSVKLPVDQHALYLDNILKKIPGNSMTYKYALGAIVVATQLKNHPNFIKYGTEFVKLYEAEGTPGVVALKQKLGGAGSFMPGGEAPDFTMKTPEGEDLKLSDLRGKVVLVDFWASWCGPCRRENPHVVKLYNQYKEKGFDVLGVSLDKKKDSWLKAIEKDGLGWHHVSDLKGWGNEVAKLYSVSSIPHTVLLDQEGKIIARNLRSAQLAQELSKIFD